MSSMTRRRVRAWVRWTLLGATALSGLLYLATVWVEVSLAFPPGQTNLTVSDGQLRLTRVSLRPPEWHAAASWRRAGAAWDWGWRWSAFDLTSGPTAWVLALPGWLVVLPLAATTGWAFSRGRHDVAGCPTCGYDRTGLGDTVCPECGAPPPKRPNESL